MSIAAGSNGAAQTVEAFNIGDGALAPAATSSVLWLAPSIGTARACTTRSGSCLPVEIALQTSALARGTFTGIVTVSDANAVDAPQDITVTVQIGGGVPDRVELLVAPGSSSETIVTTNSPMNARATTQDGGRWLTFSLTGTGSFRFTYPYLLRVTHQPGMPEGSYNGTVETTGSTFAPDNKTVAVVMRVTSQPIAKGVPEKVSVRLAQGAPKLTQSVAIVNAGLGTLAIGSVTTSARDGAWLAASATDSGVQLAVDSSGLGPGIYQGSVAVASNAANGDVTVPVELQIVAQSAPVAAFQGVVDNATFQAGSPLAAGGIASAFGEQFLFADAAASQDVPLGTQLGGVRVLVNEQPAPVSFASYGKVTFQIPYETADGPGTVRVERDGQAGNLAGVEVARRAPRLLRLGIADYGAVTNPDGTFAIPATEGIPSHPAHAGDVLVMNAIGLGPTTPAVATGAGAPAEEPLARVDPQPSVAFGGGFTGTAVIVQPDFAGLVPGMVGLYQINVAVPEDAPRGPAVALSVSVAGVLSNAVRIAIE